MFAILKKEIKAYFTSFIVYLYYALFFLTVGILFSSNCLTTYTTQFGYYVLSRAFLVIIGVLPLFTMKIFAKERRNKTDQLLFTAPISTFAILLGKYIATIIVILLPVVLTGLYAAVIASYGEMSISFLMGTYIAILLISIVAITIGIFVSAFSSNMVIAAIVTYGIYVCVYLLRILENLVSNDTLYQWLHNLSVVNKFYDMTSGIIRSGDVIYLLTIIVAFFLGTWLILLGRRQNLKSVIGKAVLVFVIMILSWIPTFHFTKVYDFTAEKLLTLSSQTKEIITDIDQVTEIYYLGDKSRVNATYKELFNEYQRLNKNIKVYYKDISTDKEFREQYLTNVNKVNEASIVVVSGDKHVYLDSADYISMVWSSRYSNKSLLEIENQITSAISYTNSEVSNEIKMIRGHGEQSLPSDFENLLLMNNYNLKDLNLSEAMLSFQESFSADCKAIIIYAPQNDYSKDEINTLKKYMDEGGKIFVALDALNEETNRLFAFLKEYGLEVQRGIVIEADTNRYAYDIPYYLVPFIEETPITNSLMNKNTQILTMTSKGILKDGKANGYKTTDILTTGKDSYSKVEDFDHLTVKSENDISGPFSIATLSENPKQGSIFLLTSNVFFDEEVDVDSLRSNRKFFLNTINYLTGQEQQILIDGKDVGSQVAFYPNSIQPVLKVGSIVVIPLFILIVGIVVVLTYCNYIKWNWKNCKKIQEE